MLKLLDSEWTTSSELGLHVESEDSNQFEQVCTDSLVLQKKRCIM
jgi:hypothetical protein